MLRRRSAPNRARDKIAEGGILDFIRRHDRGSILDLIYDRKKERFGPSFIRYPLIGAGIGALTGYAGRLGLQHYHPEISTGALPEILGTLGGAYLGYKLSPGILDKKNAARLLYLDRLQDRIGRRGSIPAPGK